MKVVSIPLHKYRDFLNHLDVDFGINIYYLMSKCSYNFKFIRKQKGTLLMKTLLELKADILKALAHPNRIRILEVLRCEETCNCELGPSLGLEQSNLSRHIAVLLQAGVIEARKQGVKTFYRVIDDRVFTVLDLVQDMVKKQTEARLAMFKA